MIKEVIKKDGIREDYDTSKIVFAISNANRETNDKVTIDEIDKIVDIISKNGNEVLSTNEINNIIEEELIKINKLDLVKKYILFNEDHLIKINTTDNDILSLVACDNKETMNENSNKKATTIPIQRDLIAGECSKDITDRLLLPEKIVKAHKDGILHFHDKDYYVQPMFNCCLVNLGDMLDNGTVINGKLIESPKSFRVASIVTTQIIAAISGAQYGGQSIDIKHLAKYLRKTYDKYQKKRFDKYVEKGYSNDEAENRSKEDAHDIMMDELKAGIQTIQYQLNTLMSTDGQTPFVTIFMHMEEGYEYEEELALLIEEILNQRIEGIKNEKGVFITPAYPKLVYVLDECNNLTGGKYDYLTKLAVKCSSKRMYPDYISAKIMRENYEGNVFSPMGCRSFLSCYKDDNGNYKFEGRFNQGVVSINLPQIGIIANKDEDKFWKLLDERLELCYEALMIRHNHLKGVISDVSPIHYQYGGIARLKKGEKIDRLLENGYSTISLGYIGLYELTYLMTGRSHTSRKGEEFAVKVMEHLRSKTDKWKKETGIGFGLYGTPAESLCYRFAKIDKERFGSIKNVTDKGYYTNSYHVDVREHIDAFKKLKFESKFQVISSGGSISYIEIPNMNKNLNALEQLVKYIYDNIQYAEFNTKSDYCQKCDFDGEIIINDDNEWECPNCHNKDHDTMNVVRRTCGYLGENYWNEGKTKEIKNRVTHL